MDRRAYVVLAIATTSAEREFAEQWAEARRAEGDDPRVAFDARTALELAAAEDLPLLPLRTAWLEPSSGSGRAGGRALFNEVAKGALPAGVLGRWQASAAKRRPDRVRLLIGSPARPSELRARWTERRGVDPSAVLADSGAFADFVARQAAIALDRTERSVRGQSFRRPRGAAEELITDAAFLADATALAARLQRAPEGVLQDAREYLEEMAAEQNWVAVEIWARLAHWIHARAYRLDVDPEELHRLRELNEHNTLVFLISHRSNLDGYVMTSLTHENALPHNHVFGGINMAFWPLGIVGRRAGTVYIRRSFRDNEVYGFVLDRYVRFLVAKRFNVLWSIEGGRSRTGKLLPPKLGLLHSLADAVEELDLRGVTIIPTGIVYDLLNEARETTEESRGAKKQAESFRWLLRFARMQRGRLGSVHVRFGEPLDVREQLRSFNLKGTGSAEDRKLTRSKLAFETCTRINRVTMVTAPALLSFSLLGVEDRALTASEIKRVAIPILDYLESRGVPMDRATEQLRTDAGLSRTLALMSSHGIVSEYTGGGATVYSIAPPNALVAAFYRNATIHCFVNRAIAEVVAAGAGYDGGNLEDVAAQALRLRDLLKFEFFFPEKEEFLKEMATELALLGGTGEDGNAAESLLSAAAIAPRTLRSFVEAYGIVAVELMSAGSDAADRDAVVAACLGRGRRYRLQRHISSEEALSLHLFRNAIKLADNRRLLDGGPDSLRGRTELARELRDLGDRLALLADRERRAPGPAIQFATSTANAPARGWLS